MSGVDGGRVSVWSTGATGLQIDVVESRQGLRELAPEWAALPPPAAAPAPTAGPEFMDAWLDTLGQGAHPRVVTARRRGRLVGVLPLAARSGRGRDGGRQVCLAGSRRPPMVDMADVRVEPGRELALAGAVVDLLESRAASWDTLYLGNLAGESRTFSAILGLIEGRGWPLATRGRTAMVIDDEGGWEHYLARRARTLRRLPRKLERLRELGELRVETALEGEAAERALEDLFDLYRARWGAGNWLDDPAYRECLRRLRAAFDGRGALVGGLWLDGRPLAVHLVFRQDGREQSLMVAASRDRELMRHSPGGVLDYLMAERAFADGMREVHLLHTVLAAKVAWSTRFVPELTAIALSPRARPAVTAAFPLVEGAILARRAARMLPRPTGLRRRG